ncbi:Cys/Met metabolism PLP-dependent enzyme [Streptomyces sp. MnatMP-M27]|uniref:PLP-dependent transferase n=1 Tax=Streptomyces sp. MnatMP-M27 TaxID=1839768 RepID=UPI00081D866B|nr:PLP-dependent transferase [Streptomyces sp. MnatMP-M27]SCF60773.1 Cys/Met metabolism PLP-dependent enzyme [Streptomyces sp. MnatMP-M27]
MAQSTALPVIDISRFHAPDAEDIVLRWQAEALRVGREVPRVLAAALGQDEGYFDQWFDDEAAVHVKIVHYPPRVAEDADQGVGAHKDYGYLALLQQDEVGGPPELAAPSRGVTDDPDNPLLAAFGESAVVGWLRSHPRVAERWWSDIVASSSLYGGTRTLLGHTFADLGIDLTFVDDPDDLGAWYTAARPTTKVFFGETLGNPRGDVLDIEAVARVVHEVGVPLVVDNTVLTPFSLRIERHVSNAQLLAEWLEERPQVTRVHYAGLPSSPWQTQAKRHLPRGAGAVLAFELAGGLEAGRRFVEGSGCSAISRTSATYAVSSSTPASTTHAQLAPDQQLAAGVTSGLVRLSVGMEGIDDLIADLETGLRAAAV